MMMMRVAVAVAAAALAPVVCAFKGTVPLLAWSSTDSNALDRLPSAVGHSSTLLEQILLNDDVCAFDAIILVSQHGLHASDLRTLPRHAPLPTAFYSAPSKRQFEYLATHPEADSLPVVADALATRCGARLVTFIPGVDDAYFEHEHATKNVVSIELPSLEGLTGAERKQTMRVYTSELVNELTHLTFTLPNNLVIYTGSPATTSDEHTARQLPPHPSPSVHPIFDSHSYSSAATPPPSQDTGKTTYSPASASSTKGGILKRYQLLNPELITSLLVVLFVLLPVLFLGFSALASIQSPLRIEAPKSFSAAGKKNQ